MLAAVFAYMSDCTTPDQRSHTFSLFMGALLVGLAGGPAVGGQIVKYTGSALSVFYLAFGMRVLTMLVLRLVPESRSSVQMAGSRQKTVDDRSAAAAKNPSVGARVLAVLGAPLRPLAIFIPPVIDRPGKAKRRDWSLTLVAVGQVSMTAIGGAIPYKIQYALARFTWTSVDIGYWLSANGIARAVYLLAILPRT
jgi:MFS family permease